MPEVLATYGRFLEAQRAYYLGGPVEPVADLLAPGVTWEVPGASPIAGRYEGRDAVLAYFGRRRALRRFRIVTHRVLHDDRGVVAFARGEHDQHTWETIGVYDVVGGRIVAGRLIALDQAAFDAIWSRAATT